MARQGKIPENLIIYSRAAEDWTLDAMWDKTWQTDDDELVHTVTGRKAFAVDKDSKSASKTAERWSNAVKVLRKQARSRIAMLFDDVEDAYEETPNDPLKNLRVFYLEIRGEGGRAYKVIDERGYVWDLREDVLVEAMIECGIKKGGILGGEYVWAILGSQIRLVRVGSQLHKDLAVSTKRGKQKKIGVRDLVVGGMYATKSGDMGVFCGFVHSHGNKKKRQLWLEISSYDLNPTRWTGTEHVLEPRTHQEAVDYVLSENKFWNYKVKQSHSYIEKLADVTVPDNIVAMYRTLAIQKVLDQHSSARDRYRGYYYGRRNNPVSLSERVKDNLNELTLSPHGQNVVIEDRISQYV